MEQIHQTCLPVVKYIPVVELMSHRDDRARTAASRLRTATEIFKGNYRPNIDCTSVVVPSSMYRWLSRASLQSIFKDNITIYAYEALVFLVDAVSDH